MARTWYLNVGAALLLAIGFGALFFSAAGDSYAAPSLVVNGTFDDNVNNWTELGGVNTDFAWDGAVDVNSDTNSGSGLLTYTGTDFLAEVISDCITLTGDATYPYEAWVRPGTQWTTTDSTIDIDFIRYDDTGCVDDLLIPGTPSTNSHGATTIGNAGGGWVQLTGNLVVSGSNNVSMQLVLRVNGETTNDSAWWDEVKIANDELDTPTPTSSATATNSPAPTNTATATNTPAPTNTAAATNTAAPTETEVPTDTPMPATNTPAPTNTAVPPTSTHTTVAPPPAAEVEPPVVEDGEIAESGVGAGGEEPEGGAAAEGEQPEGSEFPESGTGPGSYGQERSATADIIATFSFALAISMLGAGFYLRKKYEEQ